MRRALVPLLALAAGCGTTVPTTGSGALTGADPVLGGGVQPSAGPTGVVADGRRGTSPGGGGVTPRGRGQLPAIRRPSGSPEELARGVSATSIQIGLLHNSTADENSIAIGASSIAPTVSVDEMQRSVIRWINSHGGVAGRTLEPVLYDGGDEGDPATIQQAACQYWTQDHHVLAVVIDQFVTDGLRACLDKHGIPLLSALGDGADATTYAQYRGYVETASLRYDLALKDTVDGLAARGYFAGGAKVGIVAYDFSGYKRSVPGMITRIQQRGGTVADVVYVAESGSTSEISSAVLRFRRSGVDHVMFAENSGSVAFTFITAATSQGFSPRYGFGSGDAIGALMLLFKGGAASPLAGSQAVGWQPLQDTGIRDGVRVPPGWPLCARMMRESGIQDTDPNNAYFSNYCDELLLLKEMIERGRPGITGPRLLAGLAAVADHHRSGTTYAATFSASKRDGVTQVQPMRFTNSCSCFRYDGAPVVAAR